MKRWMTRLAVGAKGGILGARGSERRDVAAAEADLPSAPVRREARAILPTPMPQSRKKWRRVIWRRLACCWGVMADSIQRGLATDGAQMHTDKGIKTAV